MTREFFIGYKRVADDEPPLILAEVGGNHQGRLDIAKLLIQAAADCGVDAVKFQKRENKSLYTEAMYNSPYHSENAFGPTYGLHREALELGWEEYVELKQYAESLGLLLFATAFDVPSVDFLCKLGVPALKVASGDLQSIPLIRYMATTGKPIIVSTGGGTLEDVRRVVEAIDWQPGQLCLLQCTASYPVEPMEVNLRVIETYRAAFPDVVIGLSDHYDGILTGPLAYLLGARVFEKHFTMHHTWKGADHAFSLEPPGMRRFVRDLHRVPELLGDGIKRVYDSERPGLKKMGKSLVATVDLEAGQPLTFENIKLQSPAGGLPAWKIDKLTGRRLQKPLGEGEIITSSDVVEPL